jgi:hypothetical protein
MLACRGPVDRLYGEPGHGEEPEELPADRWIHDLRAQSRAQETLGLKVRVVPSA